MVLWVTTFYYYNQFNYLELLNVILHGNVDL